MKTIIIIILAVMLLTGVVYYYNSTQTENIYKVILKADADLMEISIDSQMADSYYDEAGYAYEEGNYKEVERNCRLAREYFLGESQGYKRVKAELKYKEIDDKLMVLYIERLNLLSEISSNMYEACEYFESAARYCDTYYNTDVPYDDRSYDMGTKEIDMMNEKIRARDNAVERYNNELEEFRVELENRLK